MEIRQTLFFWNLLEPSGTKLNQLWNQAVCDGNPANAVFWNLREPSGTKLNQLRDQAICDGNPAIICFLEPSGTIWNQAEPTQEPSRLRWKSGKHCFWEPSGTIWNQVEPTQEPSRLRWTSCKKVSIPRLLIIILLKCRGIRNQATAEASWESSRILEGGWGTEGCYARFVDIWQRRFGEPVIGWTYPEARNEQMQP